jgi:hypothetical protein
MGTGTKEESSTGRIWAAGFHHVTASSCFIYLIFKLFSRMQQTVDNKQRILNPRIWGSTCICSEFSVCNEA